MQARERPRWVKQGPPLRLVIQYPFAKSGTAADFGPVDPAASPLDLERRKTFDFSIGIMPLSPGIQVRSDAPCLELFAGLKVLPQFLAWPSGGKVAVRPASGRILVQAMDQPWLLAWWGEKTPVTVAQGNEYLKHFSRSADCPLLVLLQNPAKSVAVGKDRWTLCFAPNAGTVVLMPLFGLNNPTGEETAKWSGGLPAEVAAQATQWARRMRCVPSRVTESFEIADQGVKITESFQYEDVDDAWKTPRRSWAFLPPVFALCRAMNGPIETEQEAKELPWLGCFGPLTVLDGKASISFTIRIPQLQDYLWGRPPAPRESADPKFRVLRDQLREEIDKILEVNEHMAPFHNMGAGIGGNWHWGNPAETILTLIWALPFLEPAKAEALKAYIRREWQSYDPLKISFAPMSVGARRELHDWDPTGKWAKSGWARQPNRSPNLHNLYAAWEFVDKVAGPEAGKRLWPRAKKYLEDELKGYRWDGGESRNVASSPQFAAQAANLNARLNGYLAYTRLARLAGDKEAEQIGTCLLARGLAVTYAIAHYHQYLIQRGLQEGLVNFPPEFFVRDCQANRLPSYGANGPYFGNGFRQMEMPHKFFLDMTPEIGQFLHDYCLDPVTVATRWMMWKCPGCWLNKGLRPFPSAQGEHWIIEPWVPWTNFLALSLVMQLPPEELYYYVGDSRARLGDLYSIQKLSLALRAFAKEQRK